MSIPLLSQNSWYEFLSVALSFSYLETLISLGIDVSFPNAGRGGLVLMKKLHGACLGEPWSSSVLFLLDPLDLEPESYSSSTIFSLDGGSISACSSSIIPFSSYTSTLSKKDIQLAALFNSTTQGPR